MFRRIEDKYAYYPTNLSRQRSQSRNLTLHQNYEALVMMLKLNQYQKV